EVSLMMPPPPACLVVAFELPSVLSLHAGELGLVQRTAIESWGLMTGKVSPNAFTICFSSSLTGLISVVELIISCSIL
ncbi:hypothetical protein PSY31_23430, partial [Shigella flexneri]|nr:hypothetical protein [Shigella flexneri]